MAAVLLMFAMTGIQIPSVGLGALALLPLAAALVDAVRMRRKLSSGGEGQGGGPKSDQSVEVENAQLQEWLEDKAESLTDREQQLNARGLALQQWMQFPDAIDFYESQADAKNPEAVESSVLADDPMARHDQDLFELVEAKTRELFDSIKQDAYRKDEGDQKVFDNRKIRTDLIALVSDVAAIYRPSETAPLLKTNVESVSRAIGRASLRLLAAVDDLPGGLARYDFQSIYTLVIRAVKTFGLYKSAKPYIDVASGMLVAGRLVSSTNPVTLVAWWAASKATTYGASKLGEHVLNQQAVGLIRQLVEIVAVEVASVYSPMVRYRDAHWIYGVELVHLASELKISDSARVQAMKQLAVLNLRDEYGRVSLLRHLADSTTSRPDNYHPAKSLSAADRLIVAKRLESFLLTHVINDAGSRTDQSAINQWQTAAAERLQIQFRARQEEETPEEQSQRAIWALASFALQHLGDEPEQVIDRLRLAETWNKVDSITQNRWTDELQSDPPFLYQPPALDPESETTQRFLSDLVEMASSVSMSPPMSIPQSMVDEGEVALPPWSGEEAIQLTAYFLRSDVAALLDRFHQNKAARLLEKSVQKSVPPEVALALEYLSAQVTGDPCVYCVFGDAIVAATGQTAHLARIGSTIIVFTAALESKSGIINLCVLARCELAEAKVEKVAGYVRNDCKVTLPNAMEVNLPGSTLRGYDSYFSGLFDADC